MKLHQALLLLPLLTVDHACHATCPEQEFPGFVFFEDKDSHGNDLPSPPNPVAGDLDEMFEECEEHNEDCKAFNTNGWLKHTVVPLVDVSYQPGTCGGVYIRCRNWADLKIDVEAATPGTSANPTPFFLCSGTHNAATQITASANVAIGCSDPVSGCIADGSAAGVQGFAVVSGDATLSDLTLQGFDVAVYAVAGATVKRCNIKNNENGLECGLQNAVFVTDSEFEENAPNGAIKVSGGCSATISGSTFTNNQRSYGGGGGLRCTEESTSCAVSNSVFDGNTATGSSGKGGAISCKDEAECIVNMATCLFEDNEAIHGNNIHCDDSSTCIL